MEVCGGGGNWCWERGGEGEGAYHVKAVKTTKGLKYRAKGSI